MKVSDELDAADPIAFEEVHRHVAFGRTETCVFEHHGPDEIPIATCRIGVSFADEVEVSITLPTRKRAAGKCVMKRDIVRHAQPGEANEPRGIVGLQW